MIPKELLTPWSFYDTSHQLRDYILKELKESFALSEKLKNTILATEDVLALQARQQEVKRTFITSLGGIKPDTSPLEITLHDTIEEGSLVIENVSYQTQQGYRIPSNVYYRNNISGAIPAILFLTGHEIEGKQADNYQKICRCLALQGFLVLAQDTIGQGERQEYYNPLTKENAVPTPTGEHYATGMKTALLGENIAKYMVQDAMRGIDYLETRSDVDNAKIAVTGNSGGGTQATMVSVIDSRINASAIGTFISSQMEIFLAGKPQDNEQVWEGMLAIEHGIDHDDMLLAIAPRPVLIMAASDDFFPMEGTLATQARMAEYYSLLEQEQNFAMFTDTSPHQYTIPMAIKAAEFFGKHFSYSLTAINSEEISPILHKRLHNFSEGQVKNESKRTLSQYLKEQQKSIAPSPELSKWLSQKTSKNQKVSFAFLKKQEDIVVDNLLCQRYFWRSQERLINTAWFIKAAASTPAEAVILLVKNGSLSMEEYYDKINKLTKQNKQVVLLDVTGHGTQTPSKVNHAPVEGMFGTLYFLNSYLLRLGNSLAAMRVFDILCCAERIKEILGENIEISLEGYDGFEYLAEYASILNPELPSSKGHLETLKTCISEHPMDESYLPFIIPGTLQYI